VKFKLTFAPNECLPAILNRYSVNDFLYQKCAGLMFLCAIASNTILVEVRKSH